MFRKFREPDVLTVVTTDDDAIEALERPAYVTLVSDRLAWYQQDILPAVIKRWGYRPVDRPPEWRGTLYVRPLPLWLAHKAGHALCRGYWASLGWLYRHHVIRVACTDSCLIRFRDLRPWFMEGRAFR